MRVLLVGGKFSFPRGEAATARVKAIALGLKEGGYDVEVVVTQVTERDTSSAINRVAKGIWNGIPFRYLTGSPIRAGSFWRRRWIQLVSHVRLIKMVRRCTRDDVGAILAFSMTSILLPICLRIGLAGNNVPIIFDACEIPFPYERDQRGIKKTYQTFYERFFYHSYDGFFVISEYLRKYYGQRCRRNARFVDLPILVEYERFSSAMPRSSGSRPYLLYSGAIAPAKGVGDLLEAFIELAPRHKNLRLLITGRRESPFAAELADRAMGTGVGDRVEFTGLLSDEDFPGMVAGATALVMPSRRGPFSDAAFPTKFGEYLASGRPVVCTNVGEIGRFIQSGESAYLAEPDCPASLGACLEEILRDPDAANRVGRRGQEVAKHHFDYRVVVPRLVEMIKEMAAGTSEN